MAGHTSGVPESSGHLPVIENLQLLRAIAAILILFKHTFYEVGQMGASFPAPSYPFTIGVDIFFVLSGFVMVYTSRNLFTMPGAGKTFILRRILRIVPLYWFYTLLLAGVALVIPSVLGTASFSVSHLIQSLFFHPHLAPITGAVGPLLANGWTLDYEMYFYAIFACLLFLRPVFLMLAISFFFVVSVALAPVIPDDWLAIKFYAKPIVIDFLAGMWIAYLFIRGVRLRGIGRIYFPVVAIFILSVPAVVVDVPFLHLGIATLLLAMAVLPSHAAEEKIYPLFKKLGDSSYSLYLSHPFVLGGVTQIALLFSRGGELFLWAVFGTCIIAALIYGVISYVFIEKPLLKWGNRLIFRNRQADKG